MTFSPQANSSCECWLDEVPFLKISQQFCLVAELPWITLHFIFTLLCENMSLKGYLFADFLFIFLTKI